ncbi:helix-turn-helix transcriptional regulator [Pseudonocardiaceae bacterium YIM PH 21723]|nr:helix-turn-helix transcriptional regulator [Pseudonocardiaceae bacterium YIM PH 21723]
MRTSSSEQHGGTVSSHLLGREHELGELRRALDGAGSAVLLSGEPGIGKSALLRAVADTAAGHTVLRCGGTRDESRLAFGALHELLWPIADRIAGLPGPQAAALGGALGLSAEAAGRFQVGAAVLTLLAGLAGQRPVLLVVDDAQWLDEESADCLAFVARRAECEPLAMLVATSGDPDDRWDRLRTLPVGGVDDRTALRLVQERFPGIAAGLAQRVVRAAGGNPLALTELPGLPADSWTGDRIPVGPLLRRAFGARLTALSEEQRTLLLIAAAEAHGDLRAVRDAAGELGVAEQVWEWAEQSGLLCVSGGRLRFARPLVGAVVYDTAPPAIRRRVHRALYTALDGDRQAWHLAAAADRPDEEIAALLERAAGGGGSGAVALLRRAADLSPAPANAAGRLALAARAAWESGEQSTARELLDRAGDSTPQDLVAERSGGLPGLLEFAMGNPERAHTLLMRDAVTVTDPGLRRELLVAAVRAAWAAGLPDRQSDSMRALSAVNEDALIRWWSPGEQPPPDLTGIGAWVLPPLPVAMELGLEAEIDEIYRRYACELRGRDALPGLAFVLPQSAGASIIRGRWTEAADQIAECLRLTGHTGSGHSVALCHLKLAWLAAYRGDRAAVDEHTGLVLDDSIPRGARGITAAAYWYRGLAALGAGRAQEALGHLSPLRLEGHGACHPTFARLAAVDAVEAAVACGQLEAAGPWLAELDRWAEHSGAGWAIAARLRCRALVTEGLGAETLFRQALAVPESADRPFEHARTRLLYGEWLRRARRRTDATLELDAAREVFQRLSAEPWLERTRHELELSAGGAPHPFALTAQELRIAQQAATGLTNREIAARLLISPRTVGHHLSRVFGKLGIGSRVELASIDLTGDLRLLD